MIDNNYDQLYDFIDLTNVLFIRVYSISDKLMYIIRSITTYLLRVKNLKN
jgi:hypothetical protein